MKNLDKRKELAAKVLGVGKGRIIFDSSRLGEIKEAITKQDIRDFYNEGIISIREISGRKSSEKRTTKRGFGKIKKKIAPGKAEYVIFSRKFRNYLKELLKNKQISPEKYKALRVRIKAREFKSKAHIKEQIGGKA